MPETRQVTKGSSHKLKDWHPVTCGDVYSTYDPNVDRVDPALPDTPVIKFRPLSLIWR